MPLNLSVPVTNVPGADLKVTLKRHGTDAPTRMRTAAADTDSGAASLLSQIVQPFIGWETSLDAPGVRLTQAYRVSADVDILEQTRADIFEGTKYLYPLWARPVVVSVEQVEAYPNGDVERASRLSYFVPHDRVKLCDAALANLMAGDGLASRVALDGMREMDAYRVNIRLVLYRAPARSH
jgi:hypothetical protein